MYVTKQMIKQVVGHIYTMLCILVYFRCFNLLATSGIW